MPRDDPMTDPTSYFELVAALEQEFGHPRWYAGEEGTIARWYRDGDYLCSVYIADPPASDMQSGFRLGKAAQPHESDSMCWLAGRHGIIMPPMPPAWAEGKVADAESYESLVANRV